MPNWCSNHLEITGDKETIARFRSAVSLDVDGVQRYSILPSLFPVPKELTDTVSGFFSDPEEQAKMQQKYEDNVAKYGYKDWYDWQYDNWGTKWGDCDTELVDDTETSLSFMFESAWGAPDKGIEAISIMFPSLAFILSYEETGMGFVGASAFKAGLSIERHSENIQVEYGENIDPDDETLWDRVSEAYANERDRCEEEVRRELALVLA